MSLDMQTFDSFPVKCGDLSKEYTEDEERAFQEYLAMIERDDDEEMLAFRKHLKKNRAMRGLRACKLDPKFYFKSVKSFVYHATKTYPELFLKVDPLNLKPIIEQKLFQVVKRPVDKGPAIMVFRVKNWKPSEASLEQIALSGALYIDTIAKVSPEIQREGITFVADVSGFKLIHARQASLDLILMAARISSSLPPMVKAFVAVNSLALFESTYKIFKWILPEDIRKLVHITKTDMSHMTKLAESRQLPIEFGGTMSDDEAYIEGIEEDILGDTELFLLIKQVQSHFLERSNLKKKNKNVD